MSLRHLAAAAAITFSPGACTQAVVNTENALSNAGFVTRDFGALALADPEEHSGRLDAGLDGRGHGDVVLGNVAEERAKEVVGGVEIVAAAG